MQITIKLFKFFNYKIMANVIISFIILFLYSGCRDNQSSKILPIKRQSIIQIPPEKGKIPTPRAICTDLHDNLYVVDDAGRVLVFDPKHNLIRQWLMPKTELGHPEGIIVLNDGRIAVTDTHYSRIVVFSKEGKVELVFGQKGTNKGDFGSPVGIAEDLKGNFYVSEYGFSDRVQKFDKKGVFKKEIGKAGMGADEFQRPSGIVHYNGALYVADAVNNRLQIFTDIGKHKKTIKITPSFYLPYDIKIGSDKFIYIVEYGNNCVTKLSLDGELIGRFGANIADGSVKLKTPWGVAVDSKGVIYIADTGNRRIVLLYQ